MVNVVEKLFENVLTQLPKDDAEMTPEWPGENDVFDTDTFDEPSSSDEDGIVPYDHDVLSNRVFDRLTEGHSIIEPSSREKELVEGGIRVRGLEALAFYKTRRLISLHPFPGRWGIFYLRQGIDNVAWDILQTYPGFKDPRALARNFLQAHEHFHFRADIQTLMFETTLNKHLYLPLRRALKGRRTHFVEEALANKQAYSWAKTQNIGLQEFAHDFMALQPNAYARFDEPTEVLSGEWIANVLDFQPPGCLPRLDLAPWVEALPKNFMRRSLCPEYVIYPHRLESWLDPAWVPPPVIQIIDDPKVRDMLASKFHQIAIKWESTKKKLLENRTLRGLNFKQWPKEGPGVYSVRIDDNFRAHLRNQGQGLWVAYLIGTHKEMGHG